MKKVSFSILGILFALCIYAHCPAKVSILGDSYSTFQNHVVPDTNYVWYFADANEPDRTDVATVDDTWWMRFITRSGLQLEQNNSFSGATVCNLGYEGNDYSDRSFIRRMDSLGKPDLILVFGATNDCWAKVPLGKKGSDDLYTFIPAMDKMLRELPSLYPDARIVFMLNDEIQGDMRKAIIELCRDNNTACLQLQNISKRQGHPDKAGMLQISDQLTDFLHDNGCCRRKCHNQDK